MVMRDLSPFYPIWRLNLDKQAICQGAWRAGYSAITMVSIAQNVATDDAVVLWSVWAQIRRFDHFFSSQGV
jgi:hypothetical protein